MRIASKHETENVVVRDVGKTTFTTLLSAEEITVVSCLFTYILAEMHDVITTQDPIISYNQCWLRLRQYSNVIIFSVMRRTVRDYN